MKTVNVKHNNNSESEWLTIFTTVMSVEHNDEPQTAVASETDSTAGRYNKTMQPAETVTIKSSKVDYI